jgi:short-subunit dehydrogenase
MSVTLITGASSGMGRSLALRMAASGEGVGLLARRRELLEKLADEIRSAGGHALAVPADVTRPEEVREAVARTEASLGPIERLVANAGGGKTVRVDSFSAKRVAQTLDLNVVGVAHCIEAVLPAMLERGRGHLVATSSLAGYRGLPGAAAYGGAKAALTNMMESLRIELRGRGVAVTVILPGFVRVKPGSRKPLSLDVEDATARIHWAIEHRVAYSAFPFSLRMAVALGRMVPAGLWDRLGRRITT